MRKGGAIVSSSDFGTFLKDNPGVDPQLPDDWQKVDHEIRSAIQGLIGYLSIFVDDVRPRLDLEQVHLMERIQYFANNLSELVTDLLTMYSQEQLATQ